MRKIGELELQVQGVSATVQPANPVIPKNTAAGVRIVVTSPSGTLSSADVAKFLGGAFEVHGELSGPGLNGTITLPFVDPNGGTSPITDPLLLPIPALNEAGDYTLSNLRITVNGSPALDVSPSTIPVKVIDQVLITSVQTRPLTLDEIKAAGVDLSSNDFLGFQFTIGLALQSNATTITFPVVFNRQGVPIPPLLLPPAPPVRDQVPIPTIVPVLLNLIGPDGNPLADNKIVMPDGTPAPVKIPSVLVIPGNVGFLKQFFSAQLFVANGAPGGSGLVVHDVSGTINLPPGADGVVGTADDPLTLPTLKGVPQPVTKPVLGVGPDGQPGTSDDTNIFNPGDQGQSEFILEGQQEGFHQISFNIQGTLDGLATGPVTITGLAQGGVLVRNPFFDMTFAVPGIVRNGEQFSVYITVKNISQALANDVKVTIDSAQLSGAVLLSDPSQTINTIPAGGATTLKYQFKSLRTGQVVASYLHFDTTDGTTGELKFTLGVGERGIPLSPDTLVLPSSIQNLPQSVVDAAMLVLGEGWSIANAPAGTLPAGVIQTNKSVVTKKALALAEAGLRVGLGQPVGDAVRDLLGDFYGGVPLDPGFDQLLRSTDAGRNFERAIGAALAQPVSDLGGALNYQQQLSEIYASGQDFISFAVASGTSAAPVNFTLTDGVGNMDGNIGSVPDLSAAIPGLAQAPLGPTDASPLLALLTAPGNSPYTLRLIGTGSGTMDVAVTMPHGDGTFIRGQISGVPISNGSKARIVLDLSQPDRLVLEQDPNSDGTFPVQQPMSTTIIAPQGPKFLSANVIGPETLPGVTPLGVQMALLFDRVVDGTSAQQVSNYQIPLNGVQLASTQLSGRIVVANLQQPEGKIVPTTVAVSGIADTRGVVGPGGTLPLGSTIQDPGAVVGGRVFNGDGTPVNTAVVTYSAVPPADCATEQDAQPVGVSAIPVNNDGRYVVRYVHQDQCGLPFQISTSDPNTGGLRQLSNFVRFDGQQIVMDIAIFGRGSVQGTVSDLTGVPVPGASVVAFSQTDTQIGGQTVADGNGNYSISGITVGPIVVQAGKGNSLGHAAGTISRAGTSTTVNVTLDSGSLNVSGKLQVQQNGVTSPVPNWPILYSINDHPGLPPTPVGLVNTDANGNFTFTGVPEGNFIISAQLTVNDQGSITGVATANQNLINQNLTIVIDTVHVGTVNGKVFMPDKSTPAAGALVFSGTTGVLSDANGNYSLPGLHLQPSPLTVTAETQDGLRSGSVAVSLTQPGQVVPNANITLSGLGSAQFTVLDSSGNPVVGQNVALLGCPNACGCGAQPTNAKGIVTFTGLPVGQISVVAVSSTFDVANGTASIVSDGSTGFSVLRFAGTGTVTGNVLNPDGTPSFGANLALTSNVFNQDTCSLGLGLSQQIATDQSGNFRFTSVKVGRVGVTASQPFFPTQVGAQGAIPGAGQTVNFNLKLVNTISGVLSGTVFLPDGVTPAGAGVQVTANGVLPDVTVSTDANGHFAFAKIFPEGNYTLTASDPVSGGVIRTNVFLRAAQDMVHDLRLKGKGTVTVQVVDGSNTPVDSAFVTLTESDYPNHVQQDAVQPSNQGTVTFDQVFEGPFSVAVSDIFGRGGRSSSVLPGPGATVNVVVQLTSTGTVQGHFLMPDKTTPIPFGVVRLLAGGRQLGQVTTDGNADPGAFSFTFVPAGPVTLEAQDPVTARTGIAAGSIDSNGQTLTLDVVAQGLGTVTGVVTSNGAPQPGAQVDVFSNNYHASTVSDATGTYVVSGVPEGHIVVNASLQNGFLAGSTSGTLSGDGTQLILNVALRGSGALNGQVVQADGVTPASASLVTVQVGGQGGGTLTISTDTNGNFGFPVVPAGTAGITVNVLGSIDEAQANVEVLSGSTVQTTIRLNGIGSISGKTLDSLGNAVQGHVTVTGTGAFPYSFTLDSSTDGTFSLPTVLAGTFTAQVSEQAGGFTLFGSTSASVVPNQNTSITIQAQPSGTVTGTVLRSDGVTPASGANVTLTLATGSVVVQAQTDGTFTAQGVPLGNFNLRVNDPVSTGQALQNGLSLTSNGQVLPLGNIVLNDTPLAVVSINPSDGSTGVPINSSITIAFTDALQSLNGISFTASGNGLFLSGSLSTDGKLATFTVNNGKLPDDSSITVTVSTDVTDIFGRHPSQTTTATFQTVDLTPPRVVSVVPANGTIQVASTATITVNFDEALVTNSNLTNLIVVNGPSGPISGTTVFATPSQAVFTPASPLPANGSFTVTVNGETDPPGNVQTVPFISTFASVDTVAPVLQLQSPVNGGFISSAQPVISIGVTDNLSGVNAGSETLSIDGQAVTPQQSTSQIRFTPAAPLAQGTHTLTASAADNAGNVGNLSASFSVDSVPPTAAQLTGITNGQVVSGTINLSATATDTGSGVARIDVIVDGSVLLSLTPPSFQTTFNTLSLTEGPHTFSARAIDAAGNIGPVGTAIQVIVNNRQLTVSVTSPVPNSFFRGSVTVVASVSEVVQQVQFTLGSQTITVTAPPYQATLSLASVPDGQQIIAVNATGFGTETASTTLAINVKQTPPPAPNPALINAEPPSNGLSLVHGSATAVEAGDQVQITDTNSSVVVTTSAAANGSFSTNVAASVGDVLSIVSIDVVGNHSPAATVTVRQVASLPPVSSVQPPDGSTNVATNSVVVVRFAAPVQPASVVTGTVTLFQGTTSVSGALSLSNDQLSVTFTPAQALAGLTAYTVKVQDAASHSTTVLFQSAFTTAQAKDTTPPTILRTSPDNNASGVPLNAPYVVQFSKPMNPATFNSSDFTVRDNSNSQSVSGTIQVDSTGTIATFVPQSPWAAGHPFGVFVNFFSSGLTDTAGNSLGSRNFSFTAAFTPDNTPPSLLQVSPVNQSTGVPTNAVIDLQFSKTVDTANAANGLQVLNGVQTVAGVIAFSNGNQRLTFTPNPPLAANTLYTVNVTSSVTDVAGNALSNPG
ncbi:MAG TPA: Ig-like domain-containing protein, partial [Candidatus Angelobacter sp.]